MTDQELAALVDVLREAVATVERFTETLESLYPPDPPTLRLVTAEDVPVADTQDGRP